MTAGGAECGSLRACVRARIWHPTTIAIPVSSLVLIPLWQHHLIARIPLWVVVSLASVLKAVDIVVFGTFRGAQRTWQVWASVGVIQSAVAAGAYSLGWGPYVGIVLVFVAIDWFRIVGSRATGPLAATSLAALGAAQIAVGAGWAPIMTARGPALLFGSFNACVVPAIIWMLGWLTEAREQAEAQTRHRERYFSALVARSRDITVVTDEDGVVRYTSPAFAATLGYDNGAAPLTVADFVEPDDLEMLATAFRSLRAREPDASAIAAPRVVQTEVRLRAADGDVHWFEATIADLTDDPDVSGIVANLRDIGARKVAEDRLTFAAFHDALTGLANRALTLQLADEMLARAERDGRSVAALYVDLDDFKEVNDTLGHRAGDCVLEAVASRLAHAVRDGDVVGRLGGDEFVVLAEGPFLGNGPGELAQRLLQALETPITLPGIHSEPVSIGASVGVAMSRRGTAHDLLHAADVALYQAKAAGKRRVATFGDHMEPVTATHLVPVRKPCETRPAGARWPTQGREGRGLQMS